MITAEIGEDIGDARFLERLEHCRAGRIHSICSRSFAARFTVPGFDQVFAKPNHLLRKAAARTVEALVAAIGEPPTAPKECSNYFANASYQPT
jgi:hypothetical protein